jgi:hypothetical protein
MRLAERARDLRVQTALGAGAATLAAGLVAEAVILSAISAGAGAAIALATLKGLRFAVALDVPRLSGIGLDVRTFVGTAAIALIAASAIALLPVLRVRRNATMTTGERSPTSRVSARARGGWWAPKSRRRSRTARHARGPRHCAQGRVGMAGGRSVG